MAVITATKIVKMRQLNKKSTKGEKMLAVLDALLGVSCDVIALFLAVSSGARTLKGMRYEYNKLKIDDYRILRDLVDDVKEIRRFYSLLSNLKKQGLIYKSGSRWLITGKGKKKLAILRKQVVYQKKYYKMKPGSETVIVIFDIPERDRKKRDWIRRVLKGMSFKMLQQSVWLGKGSMPDEFMKDLRELKLETHVHIFSVKKRGTI